MSDLIVGLVFMALIAVFYVVVMPFIVVLYLFDCAMKIIFNEDFNGF